MKIEIRHLELVAALSEEGTLTKAAERLHVTQSALSHQLRDIETRLGTPLYLRINKKLHVTPAGELLLQSAHSILNDLKNAEDSIHQIAMNRVGRIRLSTECYTCYHWLPSMLKLFHAKHPQIKVQIVVEATGSPVAALLDGKIDLAIVSIPVREKAVMVKPLFQDELVVVMRPDHPLATRSLIRAKDFANEHLIMYIVPEDDSSFFRRILRPAGVIPKQISQVQLTEAAVEMVKAGLGISVMARWAVAPQISAGELRGLPLTRKGMTRQWSAAMIRTDAPPSYLLEFVKILAENSPDKLLAMPMRATKAVRLQLASR